MTEPASLLGGLTVSPASGALSTGSSVTVGGLASLDTQPTVPPGGHVVTVVVGLG